MIRRSLLVGIIVCFFVIGISFSAHAFTFGAGQSARTFTSLVTYGDSLSDDGNTGLFPLGDGVKRFTNKAIWVELLAGATGSTLYDVAFGGATTGFDNPAIGSQGHGLQWQVGAFQPYFSHNLDLNDTLFTVWAGANDFFQGWGYTQAVDNLGFALQNLADSGARDILVPNLPDLGLTPRFYEQPLQATATGWSSAYNAELKLELADFLQRNPGINLYCVDVWAIFGDLLEYDADGRISNFNELIWDGEVHPTIIGHAALATASIEAINAVPVPAALILLGSGLLGIGALRRRMR